MKHQKAVHQFESKTCNEQTAPEVPDYSTRLTRVTKFRPKVIYLIPPFRVCTNTLKMTLQHQLPENNIDTKEFEESSKAWKSYFKHTLDLTADFFSLPSTQFICSYKIYIFILYLEND